MDAASDQKSAGHARHLVRGATCGLLVTFVLLALCRCTPVPGGDSILGSGIVPGGSPGDDPLGVASALSFTAKPAFCCSPLKLDFSADLGGASPAGVVFRWSFGDGRTSTGITTQHTYPWAGTYEVELLAVLPSGTTLHTSGTLTLVVDATGVSNVTVVPSTAEPDDQNATSAGGQIFADAGPDQFVTSGDLVLLDGTGSQSPDPSAMRYTWTQLGGPSVELSADDQATISFVAPGMLNEPITLTFRLTITLGMLQDADDTMVVVEPALLPAGMSSPPVVHDLTVTISSLQVAELVLFGDDADGDDLTFMLVDPPSHGNLTGIDNSGAQTARVYYQPAIGFSGSDTFTFRATDGSYWSNTATVRLTLLGEGRPPEPRDGAWSAPTGRTVALSLVAEDEDGDELEFSVVTPPGHGSLGAIQRIGPQEAVVSYTSSPGFHGTDELEFAVSDGMFDSQPASVRVEVTKWLVPWTELNLPARPALEFYTAAQGAEPGMTVMEFGLEGLSEWSAVTREAVITTVLENVPYLYPDLIEQAPAGMRIVGGFKTTVLPGTAPYQPSTYDFSDAAAWQQIADGVAQTALLTGTNIVLLENETSLRPFYLGQESIDFAELEQSLAPLRETGVEIWWWIPHLIWNQPEFPTAYADTAAMIETMKAAVPNSRFLTAYAGWFYWEPEDDGLLRDTMVGMVGSENVKDGLFVTADGNWYRTNSPPTRGYTTGEAILEMRELPDDSMRIYPPGGDWIIVASQFKQQLPPLAPAAE